MRWTFIRFDFDTSVTRHVIICYGRWCRDLLWEMVPKICCGRRCQDLLWEMVPRLALGTVPNAPQTGRSTQCTRLSIRAALWYAVARRSHGPSIDTSVQGSALHECACVHAHRHGLPPARRARPCTRPQACLAGLDTCFRWEYSPCTLGTDKSGMSDPPFARARIYFFNHPF